jgi:hypothetical protein
MMRKRYIVPTMDAVIFDDIIITSGNNGGGITIDMPIPGETGTDTSNGA